MDWDILAKLAPVFAVGATIGGLVVGLFTTLWTQHRQRKDKLEERRALREAQLESDARFAMMAFVPTCDTPMRRIRGLALGTYDAKGADAARATPNASQVRGLVYAVKDNRVPPNPKQPIQHPLHPIGRPVQVDRTNAIEYVTAMLANRIDRLTRFFKAEDPDAITLVPVPSSSVTAATIQTARFRTLRLCNALAGVGFGHVAVLADACYTHQT